MSFEQKEWKNRLSENPTRRTLTPVDGGTAMVVDVTRNEGTVMQQGDPFNADNMNDLEQRIAEGIGGGEDIIAPVEQEESQNAYVKGQFLIFDGTLYEVISAIAIGNTLIPNVNIKEQKVSDVADQLVANNTRIYMDYKDGQYGYNTDPERGADTFHPFKTEPINLGQITTYDASGISGYQNLTVDNFVVEFISTPDIMSTPYSGHDLKGRVVGCTATKNYDASTGLFTLSGTTQTIGAGYWNTSGESDRWVKTFTQSINYRVLLFA